MVGNGLEYYDFVTFGLFASQIGRTFFPSDTPGASLLLSLLTFGAGFLTRPLGALVIGRYGDRVGRKPAMLLSFWLIGIGTIGLPLVPSFASIGLAAPLLAVCFRLLQGFALGGEVGPSTAFLMEAAPPLRRGFYISMQSTSSDIAVLIAGLVGTGLGNALDEPALDAWGWRVAMLIGGIIIPAGLVLRRRLKETLHQPLAPTRDRPPRNLTKLTAVSLAMIATGTTCNYVLQYMTTYANFTLKMPPKIALGAPAVIGAAGLIFDPLGGWLSDHFGRKRVIIIAWAILGVTIFPFFWLLDHYRSAWALYTTCAVLASSSTLAGAVTLVTITESLPRHVRAGGFGLIYALSISLFGGSTQWIMAKLGIITGNPLVPAWYMICILGVGVLAWFNLNETAPIKVGIREP